MRASVRAPDGTRKHVRRMHDECATAHGNAVETTWQQLATAWQQRAVTMIEDACDDSSA
jgi:hypothetical protein